MSIALNKVAMKSISGGVIAGCQIYSQGGPSPDSGTCGTAILPIDEASALVNQLNNSNDDYFYFKACSEE